MRPLIALRRQACGCSSSISSQHNDCCSSTLYGCKPGNHWLSAAISGYICETNNMTCTMFCDDQPNVINRAALGDLRACLETFQDNNNNGEMTATTITETDAKSVITSSPDDGDRTHVSSPRCPAARDGGLTAFQPRAIVNPSMLQWYLSDVVWCQIVWHGKSLKVDRCWKVR